MMSNFYTIVTTHVIFAGKIFRAKIFPIEDEFLNIRAGFRDAPPSPPSLSRQLETANKHAPVSGCQQLRDFIIASILSLKNIYFLLYVIVSGRLNSSDVILAMHVHMPYS